jgi:AcrR family transcriptional regulator
VVAREPGLRERFRSQVRDEVKRVALDQLAAGGPPAVAVNAIARELGVSGPALYRYFANRDELLTELTLDAYADLAAALAAAAAPAVPAAGGDGRPGEPEARLRALAGAYRGWALAQPHRYRLLYAAPVPGYDPQADRLVAAAHRAMAALLPVVLALPSPAVAPGPPDPLAGQLASWAHERGTAAEPAAALRAVLLWSRLHGLVSLEIEGNFGAMGLDGALLLDREVAAVLSAG